MGPGVDVDEFMKRQDVGELKQMLGKEAKKNAGKHIKEEKTGFKKRQGYQSEAMMYDFSKK